MENFNANLFGTSYDLKKKRNVGTQERGKCTIRHIPTACRIEYELTNGQS